MSLATRCTSCGTVFRVVQDQLKVSEGWVRCGRCESVFNALEGLLDLDREPPTGWGDTGFSRFPADAGAEAAQPQSGPAGEAADGARATATSAATLPVTSSLPSSATSLSPATSSSPSAFAPPSPSAAASTGTPPAVELQQQAAVPARAEHHHSDEGAPSMRDELLADPIDAHLFGPRKRTESAPKPAGQVGARDRLDFSDARFDSELFEDAATAEQAEADPATVTAALPLESTARPEFVRRADRHARWRSGPMRNLLTLALAVASLTLVLQAGHHFRDGLAAEWPSLRPALAAWCGLAACVLEAPRRIDAVSVESTALARAVGFDAYVLSVNLRNRAPVALALPAVDLTLTDGSGRLVSRRVLSARDFRASPQLPAGAEVPLQLTLATGRATVTGYTVEIFYP
jgi:predicted Zn finger-like uncharacterized protein